MVILDMWQIFGLANPTQHRINIKRILYPIGSLHHTVLVVDPVQFLARYAYSVLCHFGRSHFHSRIGLQKRSRKNYGIT